MRQAWQTTVFDRPGEREQLARLTRTRYLHVEPGDGNGLALAIAEAYDKGAWVCLEPGEHALYDDFTIANDNVRIVGYGPVSVLRVYGDHFINWTGSSGRLKDLAIRAASTSVPTADYLLRLSGVLFDGARVTLADCANALRVVGNDNRIRDWVMTRIGAVGVWIDGSQNGVSGCYVPPTASANEIRIVGDRNIVVHNWCVGGALLDTGGANIAAPNQL